MKSKTAESSEESMAQVLRADSVARSGVLDFQQHARGAGSLLHGTLAGVSRIVTGTDRLVGLTLGAQLIAEGTPASANLEIP